MPYSDPEKQRQAQYEYYSKNKAKVHSRSDEIRARYRLQVAAIKEASPCVDCGEFYPSYCMDLDHVSNNKESGVARMISQRAGWDKILAEIAKCEIVCANCHRKRTHDRLVS